MIRTSFARRALARCVAASVLSLLSIPVLAAQAAAAADGPAVFGIPVDFILFGLTLIGVAVFHHYTLQVALTGLATITAYKLAFTGFKTGPGLAGLAAHMHHEWVILTNLLCLLVGFALLSRHFEESRVPDVLDAYVAAFAALAVFGIPAALQWDRYSPIRTDLARGARVDWYRVGIVALILIAAIATNVVVNLRFKHLSDAFPFIGVAVWVVILASIPVRKPEWRLVPEAFKGSIFLLSLVTSATMMPVEKLPPASWETALGLGFISAVFDNIPLTALALKQGGYDWGMLAYTVGFGGSMIWFGSSAGVALSNIYPEAKSVWEWLRHGWHVAIGYVVGFFVMLLIVGWNPHEKVKATPPASAPYVLVAPDGGSPRQVP